MIEIIRFAGYFNEIEIDSFNQFKKYSLFICEENIFLLILLQKRKVYVVLLFCNNIVYRNIFNSLYVSVGPAQQTVRMLLSLRLGTRASILT